MTSREPDSQTFDEPPAALDSDGMSRILLLLDHEENSRLLAEWLSSEHEVVQADPAKVLDETIDLCIVDQSSLQRYDELLLDSKEAVRPVFLPYLLVVSQRNSERFSSDIWKRIDATVGDSVDDLVTTPIQKAELNGRIENLLRTRRQSLRLNEQKEELETLHHVNTIIRTITRALAQASTREEIEQTVCDCLVEAGPYPFAWIGEPDSDATAIEPLAWAGTDTGDFEDVTVPFDESETGQGPTGTAVSTREMQVSQDLSDRLDSGPWKEYLTEAGLESVVSIPLAYGETLYGVLNVYADHAGAFDSDVRDLLAELGETIPYAMQTVIVKERYRSFVEDIFGTSEVGVRILDAAGTTAWTNEAFEQYFGVDRTDVIGQDNARFVQNDLKQTVANSEPFAEIVTAPYDETTDVETFECHVLPAESRDERYLHYRSQRIESGRYEGGHIELYYDITKRKRVEAELEETVEKLEKSNERLESFASMLAHELRNPVTIGQIYSQQLPTESESDAVEYVTEAFDRIENMIDVMLVLTQGREAVDERNPISLSDVALDAWDDVDAPDATIVVEIEDEIQADETYVRHLFRNLFENAVQHGGADVSVRVERLPNGFYVADDGCGIPTKDRDTVFETGFTTVADEGGTGLGLAFVRELADVYDWTCAVSESATGGAHIEFRDVDFVSEE